MPMMSPWPSKNTSWKWIALPLEHLCSMRCGPQAEKEGRSHKARVLMFPRGGPRRVFRCDRLLCREKMATACAHAVGPSRPIRRSRRNAIMMQDLPNMEAHIFSDGHFLLETHAEPALSLMMEFIKRTQGERRNLPEGTPARLLRSPLRARAPRRTTCVTWRAA
jgi:hypothetical protein